MAKNRDKPATTPKSISSTPAPGFDSLMTHLRKRATVGIQGSDGVRPLQRFNDAIAMLRRERFHLFAEVNDHRVAGIVRSQSNPKLIYACQLTSSGSFTCCTQNLNVCGGLHGVGVCKHILVLVIGLAASGAIDPPVADRWLGMSRWLKGQLDKELMGGILLRFAGVEAGQVDWRPTETVPEDYYAL